MSQPLNTSSLFQTSLRCWQAEFKAHREGDTAPAATAAPARRLLGASTKRRLGQRATGFIPAGGAKRRG